MKSDCVSVAARLDCECGISVPRLHVRRWEANVVEDVNLVVYSFLIEQRARLFVSYLVK
jgi:hypothetical protein